MDADFTINNLKISKGFIVFYSPRDSKLRKFFNIRSRSQIELNKIFGKEYTDISLKNYIVRWKKLNPTHSFIDFVDSLQQYMTKDKIILMPTAELYIDETIYYITEYGMRVKNNTNNKVLKEFLDVFSSEKEFSRGDFIYEMNSRKNVLLIFMNDVFKKLLKHGLIETEEMRLLREKHNLKARRELEKQKFKINSFLQGAKETLSPAEVSQKSLKQVCRSKKISCGQEMTKSQLIGLISEYKSLRTSHHEQKKEQQKEDIFGNQIIDPVLGDDGVIYDKKSMQEWFKKDADGQYININYTYKNNKRVPNFVSLGGKKPLTSYKEIK